jgi:hypothetical protein
VLVQLAANARTAHRHLQNKEIMAYMHTSAQLSAFCAAAAEGSCNSCDINITFIRSEYASSSSLLPNILPLRYSAVESPEPVGPAAAAAAAGGGASAAGFAAAAAVLLLGLAAALAEEELLAAATAAAAAATGGGGGGDSSLPLEASGITGASAAKKSSSEITGGGGGAGGLGRIAGPPRPGVEPLLLSPASALSEFKLLLLPPAAEGPLGGRPLLLLLPLAEGLARKERS